MMGPEAAGAAARIRESTFSEYADRAVDLYQRLDSARGLYDETIEFGPTGIDVGSRDGRFLGVMRELGVSGVVPIDPVGYDMLQGIRAGFIEPENHFIGTLEEWLDAGNAPVDTVFALNPYPRRATDVGFVAALAAAVKPGGLLVASFAEQKSSDRFFHTLATNDVPLDVLYPNPERYAAANITPGLENQSNAYLTLLRRRP